jgi:hypothetical protein
VLDPILSIAISIQKAKGVYALLLGSGVSRSSGVPTGWDVVLDLIRKIASIKGENCEPDPEAWYKGFTGNDPDYSDMLDQLTRSSAERTLLLRSYFEPSEDDREQGRKNPSPAHRAIAQLVQNGYVRVVVTTNLDRLLEQALADLGIQPTVISTADAVEGALPLVHSPCSIIKVSGDYLDARIKNTRQELAAYHPALDDLLNRVFDEYGLLVCGWSAEWDIALRAALERCKSHRFGTYWTAYRGALSPVAEKVVAQRRASVINISGSDEFFLELADKVQALESLSLTDPVSAKVAVARAKRYLTGQQQTIQLHDLINAESQRVYAAIREAQFSMTDPNITPATAHRRLAAYESIAEVMLAVMACCGYWSSPDHHALLCRVVKRIAEDDRDASGTNVWVELRRYPGLLLLYTTGIAAVAGGNYALLDQLFDLTVKLTKHNAPESILEALSPLRVLDRQYKLLPGRDREFTPLNNHLFETLRTALKDYLPDEASYDEAFDWFEYLLGLGYADRAATADTLDAIRNNVPEAMIWAPIGRFAWNRRSLGDGILARTRFDPNGPYPTFVTQALQAGLFGSSPGQLNYKRFLLIKRGFDSMIAQARRQMGIW